MRSERMTRHLARWVVVGAVVSGVAGLGGCLQILGDDGTFIERGTGGGGTGGTTGGTGGVGGTGGTTGCEPGLSEACYDGPDGTQGTGICEGGTRKCGEDRTWGVCDGEVLPTTETCVTKTDEDCDNKECALWSSLVNASTAAIVTDLQADSKGNVIVLGAFQGTFSIGGNTLDSSTGGPVLLAKFDSTGALLWAHNYGGMGVELQGGFSLAVDVDDNVYVGTGFSGLFGTGQNPYSAKGNDFWIAKLTPTGVKAWENFYGGQDDQELHNIAVDTKGTLRALGTYTTSFQIGGTSANGDGAFVVDISGSNGFTDSTMVLNLGAFVDPHFAVGTGDEWVLTGRCKDGDVVGGMTLSPCNHFVARFDPSDALKWAVTVPLQTEDVLLDSTGDVLMTTSFTGNVTFGSMNLSSLGGDDVIVAKLGAADGSILWAKSWGGAEDEVYAQLTVDAQDRFYFVVNAQDTIDFGGGPLAAAGAGDTFLAAFDSNGNHRWSRVFGDATLQSGLGSARPDGKGVFVAVTTIGDIDFGAGSLHSEMASIALAELAP